MKTLRQTLRQAESDAVAIGHFNISGLLGLKAAFDSARELSVPVMVGTSECERDFMGVHQAAALVKSLREQYEFPIFLNADHTHSLRAAIGSGKGRIRLGFLRRLEPPFEKNIPRRNHPHS
jgi:fructose-bisphosphate aldolase class II